jgi:hypothetical protein
MQRRGVEATIYGQNMECDYRGIFEGVISQLSGETEENYEKRQAGYPRRQQGFDPVSPKYK